ncbi:hypothetical protein [Algoriphagus sp. Y33]|uniref:hypothetical protein n=1 Tax=Algoriphagus sp. Y33 TaxID=2772483 RepID=UPI0017870F49|nr:hypothetical protein [Algoriphagus sp. Y33]
MSKEVAVYDVSLLQNAIRSVFKFASGLFSIDPFYYFLRNSCERFDLEESVLSKNINRTFNDMLNMDFSNVQKIPEKIALQLIQESKDQREIRVQYAKYLNSILPEKLLAA